MVNRNKGTLQQEVLRQYSTGKISAGRGAEILGISLREFLDLLERKSVAINWDSDAFLKAGDATFGE